MNKKNIILFFIIILLALTQVGLLIFILKEESKKVINFPDKEGSVTIPGKEGREQIEEDNQVLGAIIPHHLIVQDKIQTFFKQIGRNDYESIVLIGPNHANIGPSKIIYSTQPISTDKGLAETDADFLEKLSLNLKASNNAQLLVKEISIMNLVPIIKENFPSAKIIPLILKSNTEDEVSGKLAKEIYKYYKNKNVLVLASVDFSHYQPLSVAELHDAKSQSVIENYNYKEVHNLEIDSPSSIYAILKYTEMVGAKKSRLIFHTNSSFLNKSPDSPSTSHLFYNFSRGENNYNATVNFLFFGDLMLDRYIGEKVAELGADYLFKILAGEENRFFRGVDLISANLEGGVTDAGLHYKPDNTYDFTFKPETINGLKKYNFNLFNLANNHFADQGERGIMETRANLVKSGFIFSGCRDAQAGECSATTTVINDRKISLIGISQVYQAPDREIMLNVVREAASTSDLTIVNMHWGVEYEHQFSNSQQETGRALIDAGADIIIGHHPHVVQGMEIYKGKPVFYSLGNFIFDQYFSADTQEGLAVGMSATDDRTDIYLYPLKSKFGQPTLMLEKEKENFFKKFIEWSDLDEATANQIKDSKIIIKN